MDLNFNAFTEKTRVFENVQEFLNNKGFTVASQDHNRPWGGFFVIDERQTEQFITEFFPELPASDFEQFEKLSPKILVVAPQQRLSWQYHHRRAELWKLIGGQAAVVRSETDELTEPVVFSLDELVRLKCGERHRLVGTKSYGIVAEIWQHTDSKNPSDEDDIVRLQDDFGR